MAIVFFFWGLLLWVLFYYQREIMGHAFLDQLLSELFCVLKKRKKKRTELFGKMANNICFKFKIRKIYEKEFTRKNNVRAFRSELTEFNLYEF
jgi:hypothetical protein